MADSIDLLRPSEVIEILGVSDATLRRWTKLGHIPVIQIGPKGYRRYRREDVERLLEPSVGD